MAIDYKPLTKLLQETDSTKNRLDLSLGDITALIGKLPPQARREGWWTSRRRAQGRAWRTVGWKVESVDLDAGIVTFARIRQIPAWLRGVLSAVLAVATGVAINYLSGSTGWLSVGVVLVIAVFLSWATALTELRGGYLWAATSVTIALASIVGLTAMAGKQNETLSSAKTVQEAVPTGPMRCLQDNSSDRDAGAESHDIDAGGSAAQAVRVSAPAVISSVRIVAGVNETFPGGDQPRPMKVQLKGPGGEILAESQTEDINRDALTEYAFDQDVALDPEKVYTIKVINTSSWIVGLYVKRVRPGETLDPNNGVYLEKELARPDAHRVPGTALSGCVRGRM
ncbi:hypothetical protein GT755_11420 [Herbidospora sp. NEAU-GS84]|uniref:DUF7662 domain-containing protein n=1 Tax=Herbidospora solisilvae TaxID=2696284 RepID=A0A7C9MWH7_9ACTN|nr:hypothetical protein [Herbidospora solisilvae]NAS22291.1 hypothetical protein [Herbidospora solisilvae]